MAEPPQPNPLPPSRREIEEAARRAARQPDSGAGPSGPSDQEGEIVADLTTRDGFRFTTTVNGRRVSCWAKRSGWAVSIGFMPAPGQSVSDIPQETLELCARNLWWAAEKMRRRGEL